VFGLGGGEIAIILVLVLLIFGPSQLPNLARGLGQAMKEFRKAQREIKDEIQREDPPGTPKPPDDKPVG
jgi:sec-independent protein translocase protein TatA